VSNIEKHNHEQILIKKLSNLPGTDPKEENTPSPYHTISTKTNKIT